VWRAPALAAVLLAALPGAAASGTDCRRARCPAGIVVHGTLADSRGSGTFDASLRMTAGAVELVGLDGRRDWRANVGGRATLVASGELTGDRVPDHVVWVLRDADPPRRCGADAMQVSTLLALDGRTGAVTRPFPDLLDICWETPTFTYPTHQWEISTVYIGDLTPALRGNEVVAFPYFATEGWVWNRAAARRWQRVAAGARNALVFPSTAAYEDAYAKANGGPCSVPAGLSTCWVQHAHVPNAVFVPGGLLALTTFRALVYRPDFAPTSDTTWQIGGTAANGGRNYGLVTTFARRGTRYATLAGGCTVAYRRAAMGGPAAPFDDGGHCGIVRHFEAFRLAAGRIVQHRSAYHGYSVETGPAVGRVEFPRHAVADLTGRGSAWSLYNLFRDGRWRIQLYADPLAPRVAELDGWFVWDAVDLDRDGRAELLATRTPGLVPPWSFDVLRWDGRRVVSRFHADGVAPALLRYPSTAAAHSSESDLYGVFARDTNRDGPRELLVEDRRGRRFFQRWR
jgi:hypothetical protein